MPSGENRLSDASAADPDPAAAAAAGVAPNPPLVCPKVLLLPAVAPNPPPVFAVEEKLNPEADPNPDGAAGLSVEAAAKEKLEAAAVEEGADEPPNPEGGCVGAAKVLPKPDDDGAAEEPKPADEAKLKLLAWAGAPKSLFPKLDAEDPNPLPVEPKLIEDA